MADWQAPESVPLDDVSRKTLEELHLDVTSAAYLPHVTAPELVRAVLVHMHILTQREPGTDSEIAETIRSLRRYRAED